jgi:Tfp pilus assembly protein FimV
MAVWGREDCYGFAVMSRRCAVVSAPAEGMHAMAWVPVQEAAHVLGVSPDTIKRRMRAGEIPQRQEKTRKGFRWLVEVSSPEAAPVDAGEHASADAGADAPAEAGAPDSGELEQLRQRVTSLEQDKVLLWEQLKVRDREVEELHVLLQRSQESRAAVYLPAEQRNIRSVGAGIQVLSILRESWWWKKLFAPAR